ncbi:formamidopyrimidine-DNA glycosylase [Pseudonocardia sulfidoxydans NBRC 16205]|uniref:Formamidopyrimidine-DNA glycosylase n=1 Tax=Pseudonocardia sulfidoxydans NBRC 16205 TaxID=1223511 RepID=A0A511DGI3_9PSEU|nr:DNA-formamidopyrimidine glycosylase family protein [Pseudonocardia sulfidoxydans]GEL22854.1 formamidopyrimidine-DNA glycosylase [Pseudonocardia sulfidoxydans NBRC 16205]
MPELPEVEQARRVLEHALDRRIVAVDDTDEWVCRPHPPGEIASVLVGGALTAAHRRGKTMWCDTRDPHGDEGPTLGVHLGMGGRIVVTDAEHDQAPRKPEWNRFTVRFDDGGELRLFDKRRLGRVRLDPDVDALGPDAEDITAAELRTRLGRSHAPLKARLLDQKVLSGVGNLLADETLWQARLSPSRPSDELDRTEVNRLHRNLERALQAAIANGGVHTGRIIEHRHPGATCPRCGAPMVHGTVGGRSTWWCEKEQR